MTSDEQKAAPAEGPDQPAAEIACSTTATAGRALGGDRRAVPAAPGDGARPGGRRRAPRACSVPPAPATPPATAAWSRRCSSRLPSQRPYGGYFDEIADDLERGLVGGAASFGEAVERVVVDRGELTLFVRREHLPAVAGCCATTRRCASRCAPASPACTTRPRPAASCTPSTTSSRSPTVPAGPPRGDLPRRRRAHPVHRLDLPDQRLARARDLGHVRHRLRRPPGPDPDPHARRLAGPPAAQGLPARRHPGRVQGRRPSRRRTSGGRTTDVHHRAPHERPRHLRHLRRRRRRAEGAQSSTSPAATGTSSSTRPQPCTRSASSSTWARSTRRRTACCA